MTLRLVETKEESLSGPYVTLSHCWGGKLPLRLLTQNREDHKMTIPLSTIPPLYLDAATVALNLNVEYIWIDALVSLCLAFLSR